MNPQQFQGMMGRGMPNMAQMNQNFQMNPQMMNQMGMNMQPGMAQQMTIGHPQIQRHIFASLQNQGPFGGWQANVSIQERAAQVKQIVDSLRLVRPPVDLPRAVEVALQFERKCFSQSNSKDEYLRECNEKLGKIRDQRAQQLNPGNMQMQGMPMQNQNFQMQQMPMGQNGQMQMQQNMPVQQIQQQIQSPMFNQPRPNMQNQVQNNQAQPRPNQATELTQEENHQINRRAADLARETTKDQMRQIVDRMNPQLKQNLLAKSVEPIIYYFRMMATREFRRQKAEANGQIPSASTQSSNPPFMNDMGRFQGLQAEGIRSEQGGEMVVPASNNQGIVPNLQMQQQMLQQQRMNQQTPGGMNAAMMEQRRMAAQKQAQMRAQQGNQNATPGPTSQSNTPLSNLNRPVNLSQNATPQPGSRPPSRTPQQMDPQQREKLLSQYPIPLQNVLRQKPQNEWQATIQAFRQNNMQNNMQRSTSQQPQMTPQQQLQNGAFLGGANIGAAPMQQSLSTGAVGQDVQMQGQPQMNNEQLMRQRQAAMQQQQRMQDQAGKPQPQAFRPLNQVESNFMDKQPVPPTVLQNLRQQTPIPPNVKVWIDLKRWLMQNPLPTMPMPQLIRLQANHFALMMKAQAQRQGSVPQQAQMPQMPAQNVNNQQMPRLQPPTMEDIQRMRSMNPKFQQLTDDQIKMALMNRQKQQIQSQMQQRQQAGMQPQMMQQNQPAQPAQPPAQPQPRPQPVKQPPPQPPTEKVPAKRSNEPAQPEVKPTQAQQPFRQLTKEEFAALPNQQKQMYMRQIFGRRVSEISKQVAASMPRPAPVNMDPASRNRMMQRLNSPFVNNMLKRYDQFMFAYNQMDKNETELTKLIKYKLQLLPLFDPKSIQTREFNPNENLTMSPETLEEILNDISAKFQRTFSQLPKTQQPQPPAQLTPENLSRLEAQEQERKKSKASVPAAPTTDRPPFQIGDAKGHGTPRYGAPGLKQEDLKLPANTKRQKKNPPATPQTPTPAPVTTPQQTKPQTPTTFKCKFPNCEHSNQGFNNQSELDQHINTAHKIEMEPVTDPLAFLDASLREAFNLDENFHQIKKPEFAKPMQRTASKVKNESPMTRTSSQSKDWKEEIKATETEEDLWKHSNITLEEINTIFGDMDWEEVVPAAALKLQDEFIENYQKSEEWQKLLKKTDGETPTEKSTSPPTAKDKEPVKKDETLVDLNAIDGLDLGDFTDLDMDLPLDVTMSGDGSPFEVIDKPGVVTLEQQFLLDQGIDYMQPDNLTHDQKQLMNFIMEPESKTAQPKMDDSVWEDIDWDASEKQRLEDVKNGVPGTWTGNGFIPYTK